MRIVLAMVFWAAAGLAQAQGDVGLVNMVSGDISFVPQLGQPGKVKAFMKVREGDRFELPAGAQVRVVYFDGARQERWQGPAVFRAGKVEGSPISGKAAEVLQMPANAAVRMARVPELMQNAKLGGIQVRGSPAFQVGKAESVEEARATYTKMRGELAADDITPELFLFSALNDHRLYDDMVPVVNEILRRQPESEDVKALAGWLIRRRGSP